MRHSECCLIYMLNKFLLLWSNSSKSRAGKCLIPISIHSNKPFLGNALRTRWYLSWVFEREMKGSGKDRLAMGTANLHTGLWLHHCSFFSPRGAPSLAILTYWTLLIYQPKPAHQTSSTYETSSTREHSRMLPTCLVDTPLVKVSLVYTVGIYTLSPVKLNNSNLKLLEL